MPDARPAEAWKARVYLKLGRLSDAQDWAQEHGLTVDDELSYLHEFEHITLARVLLAAYQSNRAEANVRDALGLLDRLLNAAKAEKRTGSLIEILIVQALAQHARGNKLQSLASLKRALTLAEPEGYLRIFVDEGEVIKLLIEDFRLMISNQSRVQDDHLMAYADQLLNAFAGPLVASPSSSSPLENQKHLHLAQVQVSKIENLVDPLSERELEVLRLVAQGLSNDQISKRLFLSVSTVKGHNLRIFNKLQAKSRTEAVARARDLGLL
jgi:LuxR family maltose regulon positive regulatory protein